MTWKTFWEINGEVFKKSGKGSPATFWKLATALAGLAGVLAAYLGVLNVLAHALIRAFDQAGSEAAIKSWDAAPHYVARTACAALVLLFVYGLAFTLTASGRLEYRKRLAHELGVKFLSVKREHDVLNLTGQCRSTSTERLEVYDFNLSYIERRLQVTSSAPRSDPDIQIEGLPAGAVCNRARRDEGQTRIYTLNFVPPLRATQQPVQVRISEVIDQGITIYEEDTVYQPVFQNRVEFISQLVIEPIDRLELSVTFPHGYQVGGQSQVAVRYGRTPTVHEPEEHRLHENGAVSATVDNERQTLKLVVTDPIVGLLYYLFWIPPQKPAAKPAADAKGTD